MLRRSPDGVLGSRSPNWAFMSRMVIPSKRPDAHEGEFYLSRLRIIQTPYFSLMLHKIGEPDNERDPHDHPWDFRSLILKGGYSEAVYTDPGTIIMRRYMRRWNRFSFHSMSTEKAHRIEKVDPGTVSLIFCGRRKRSWGFWTREGWVDWREYKGYGSAT